MQEEQSKKKQKGYERASAPLLWEENGKCRAENSGDSRGGGGGLRPPPQWEEHTPYIRLTCEHQTHLRMIFYLISDLV